MSQETIGVVVAVAIVGVWFLLKHLFHAKLETLESSWLWFRYARRPLLPLRHLFVGKRIVMIYGTREPGVQQAAGVIVAGLENFGASVVAGTGPHDRLIEIGLHSGTECSIRIKDQSQNVLVDETVYYQLA